MSADRLMLSSERAALLVERTRMLEDRVSIFRIVSSAASSHLL